MTEREALKLVAQAIEEGWSFDRIDTEVYGAIQEALAQPEQKKCDNCGEFGKCCLAQEQDKFCDNNCVWTNHHPDCKLTQPEQEPVANYCKECLTYNGHHEGCNHYTTPPQRKPLTDEWILSKCGQTWVFETAKQWIRLAEAAHGIKGDA